MGLQIHNTYMKGLEILDTTLQRTISVFSFCRNFLAYNITEGLEMLTFQRAVTSIPQWGGDI